MARGIDTDKLARLLGVETIRVDSDAPVKQAVPKPEPALDPRLKFDTAKVDRSIDILIDSNELTSEQIKRFSNRFSKEGERQIKGLVRSDKIRAVEEYEKAEKPYESFTKSAEESVQFFVNAFSDLKDITGGVTQLMGAALKAPKKLGEHLGDAWADVSVSGYEYDNPLSRPETYDKAWESTKGVTKAVLKDFKDRYFTSVQRTAQEIYDHPLLFTLDAMTILAAPSAAVSVSAKGAGLAGRITGTAARVAAKAGKTAPKVAKATDVIADSLAVTAHKLETAGSALKKTAQGLSTGNQIKATANAVTRAAEKSIPGFSRYMQRRKNVQAIQKIVNNHMMQHMVERGEDLGRLEDAIKPLSAAEREVFRDVAEGFKQIPKSNQTPEFQNAMNVWRSIAGEQTEDLIKAGRLSKETAERRKYVPIAIEKGVIKADEIDTLKPQDIANLRRELRRDYAIKEIRSNPKAVWEKIEAGAYLGDDVALNLLDDIENTIKTGPTPIVDDLLDSIARDADPLYVPYVLRKTDRASTYLPNLRQHHSAKSTRKMSGKIIATDNWERDILRTLKQSRADFIKMKSTEQLIDKILKSGLAKPVDKLSKEIMPGHRVFSPDGFLRFYKQNVVLTDDVIKAMEKVEGLTFEDAGQMALSAAFDSMKRRNLTAVAKNTKLYQIPEEVANFMASEMTPTANWVKLAVDQPINAWKTAVLTLSPRWMVNNWVGNTVLSTLKGTNPKAFTEAVDLIKNHGDVIPPEVLQAGFFRSARVTEDLGKARNTLIGGWIQGISDSKISRAIKKVPASIGEFNEAVEDVFRAGVFWDELKPMARQRALKKAGASFYTKGLQNTLDDKILQEAKVMVKGRAPEVESAIKNTFEFMFNYRNLNQFERRVVRRMIPFYSWFKHMAQLTAKLPGKHPLKMQALRGLGNMAQEVSDNEWREHGINPEQLDDSWRKHSVTIFGDEDKLYRVSGFSKNPFYSTLELNPGMITPLANIAFEHLSGISMFTGKPFSSPGGGITGGSVDERGNVSRDRESPGLLELIFRSFPQYQMVEDFLAPYARYETANLFNLIDDYQRVRAGQEPKWAIRDPETNKPLYEIDHIAKAAGYFGFGYRRFTKQEFDKNLESLKKIREAFYDRQFREVLKRKESRKWLLDNIGQFPGLASDKKTMKDITEFELKDAENDLIKQIREAAGK